MARAAYNNPNLSEFGKRRVLATVNETNDLNKAINHIALAKKATTETDFNYNVSEAFKLCRAIWRGRNLD